MTSVTQQPHLRGWLRIDCPVSSTPRRCFCVLDDSHLAVFDSDRSESPYESIDVGVDGVAFIRVDSSPTFCITSSDLSEHVFTCASAAECERWLSALQRSVPEKVSIDSFEMLSVLGRGASGKVMLARKRDTELLYAVKTIRKDRLSSLSNEFRIMAERNTLTRASHPFITHLHYAFQTPERFYFVMEYVGGGDLRHHLNQGIELTPFQIQLYLAEITVALRQIHQLGIVYRDLKPENILIDVTGHIKLADFGLASELDRDQQGRYSLCGTFEYIAPEMIRCERQGIGLDWWALGVLAYRLIVGLLPFQNENRKRLFDTILRKEPRIPAHTERAAASLIRGLLQKDPERRLGADIEAHDYFKGLSWERVEAMEYDPPFKPTISRSDSVSNFDRIFTSENVDDSFAQQMPAMTVRNFSFQEDAKAGADE